jgi:hypothetical protein
MTSRRTIAATGIALLAHVSMPGIVAAIVVSIFSPWRQRA